MTLKCHQHLIELMIIAIYMSFIDLSLNRQLRDKHRMLIYGIWAYSEVAPRVC